MIGTDQEPAREILDRLNATLGEGKYEIRYEENMQGVRAIVRLRDDPPRNMSRETAVLFAPGAARQQVDAVWQAAVDQLVRTYEEERAQEQAQAQQQAGTPPPSPTPEAGAEPLQQAAPEGSAQPTQGADQPATSGAPTAAESRAAADLSGGSATTTRTTEGDGSGLGARIKGAIKGKGSER